MKPTFARSRKALIATGLVVALAAGSTGALAWGGGNKGPHEPSQRFEYIFNQLNLTEEQSTQVIDIMQSFAESQRQAMQERRDSGAERPTQEEMDAIRAEARQQLSDQLGTVLQPTQVEELTTYLEFHSKGMGSRGHHRGGFHHQAPEQAPEASE